MDKMQTLGKMNQLRNKMGLNRMKLGRIASALKRSPKYRYFSRKRTESL